MTDEQTAARGHRAYSELTELNSVFDKLEQGIFLELRQTPLYGQDPKVHRLHVTLHTLASIRQALREMIDHGRVAEQALAVAGLNRPN